MLSLLNYGDEPVRGLEIRWMADAPAVAPVTAFDAAGTSGELQIVKLDGGCVGVRLPVLDVELFLTGMNA